MWEQKIKAVIMVANLIEGGRSKCAPYWPEGRGQTLATPLLTITKLSQVEDDAYDPTIITTVLEMEHRGTGEKRTMKHIQFKDWPDHVRRVFLRILVASWIFCLV
jgi:protein tyrosine phosphatase